MKTNLSLHKNVLQNPPHAHRIAAMAQVGWLGKNGNVYSLEEEAKARVNEPGGYSPLSIQIGEWMLDKETGKYLLED